MTRDDIIRMAREAGASQAETRMNPGRPAHSFSMTHLERFAVLVAAAEREACAEIEKELMLSPAFFATMDEYNAHKDAVLAYRNLILAREQV